MPLRLLKKRLKGLAQRQVLKSEVIMFNSTT